MHIRLGSILSEVSVSMQHTNQQLKTPTKSGIKYTKELVIEVSLSLFLYNTHQHSHMIAWYSICDRTHLFIKHTYDIPYCLFCAVTMYYINKAIIIGKRRGIEQNLLQRTAHWQVHHISLLREWVNARWHAALSGQCSCWLTPRWLVVWVFHDNWRLH